MLLASVGVQIPSPALISKEIICFLTKKELENLKLDILDYWNDYMILRDAHDDVEEIRSPDLEQFRITTVNKLKTRISLLSELIGSDDHKILENMKLDIKEKINLLEETLNVHIAKFEDANNIHLRVEAIKK